MDELFQQLSAMLELLQQPVLLLDAEQLTFQNAAAREQLPPLTSQEAAGLTEGMVLLGGRSWIAAVRQVGVYRVVTLEPADEAGQIPTQMLDAVAQTLRGPLSTAFSVSQNLFSHLEESDNPRLQRQSAALNRSFYQMLRLVGNLSDLSLYLQGARELSRQQVEINSWLEQLGARLEYYFSLQKLTLEVQTPGEYCYVSIDADEVERAILNLISNAMKFTPAGGRIVLRLEIGRTQLRIKVLDDGEGMSPEILETLYWRALNREPLGDPRWGVGLGMQLVRQVAIAHGGTVLAERREGGGTCVTISLERVRGEGGALRSPLQIDYAGGYDHVLVGLSDALPSRAFDPGAVN